MRPHVGEVQPLVARVGVKRFLCHSQAFVRALAIKCTTAAAHLRQQCGRLNGPARLSFTPLSGRLVARCLVGLGVPPAGAIGGASAISRATTPEVVAVSDLSRTTSS